MREERTSYGFERLGDRLADRMSPLTLIFNQLDERQQSPRSYFNIDYRLYLKILKIQGNTKLHITF